MGTTKIEWADRVWNPVTGCTKVSEGCRNCYAERIAKRFWGERPFSQVQCHKDRLDDPLHWRKPRRVFVDSMSDLFHPDVPDEFIFRVFKIMEMKKHHTFIILTKRPDRMKSLCKPFWREDGKLITYPCGMGVGGYTLPNVWLGVSVENQKTADERIPLLLQTPAAVRFVSIEPMLGPVNLNWWLEKCSACGEPVSLDSRWRYPIGHVETIPDPQIDWVICGGETGPGARPMHPDWARSVRDQCQAAGVPFFFKGFGQWRPSKYPLFPVENKDPDGGCTFEDGTQVIRLKSKAGRLLDGQEWNEFPEVK